MFEWLVDSVIGFGAEIWAWKVREKMEKVQEKYIRWLLGRGENAKVYGEEGGEKRQTKDENGEKSSKV